MRGVPISKSLGDLGLEPHSRIYNDVKSSISSFMKKTVDVYTALDEDLEDAAHKYLNDPNGAPNWVDIPGLRYRWSMDDDREEIQTAVFRVMQSQQENAIKTLHQKEGPCRGCRIHPRQPPSRSATASPEPPLPAEVDIPQVTVTLRYCHLNDHEQADQRLRILTDHQTSDTILTFDDPRDPDYSHEGHSRKRKRRSTISVTQDNGQAGPSRPRVPNPNPQDTISAGSDPRVTIDSPTQDSRQAGPSRPRAPTTVDLQDTTSIRSGSRPSINTPTFRQIQPSNEPDSSITRAGQPSNSIVMDLRGKKWIFSSVEEQARILADVVAHQLEVMESLLAEMDGDKAQLRRRALQCERRLEDYLFEKRVELSR